MKMGNTRCYCTFRLLTILTLLPLSATSFLSNTINRPCRHHHHAQCLDGHERLGKALPVIQVGHHTEIFQRVTLHSCKKYYHKKNTFRAQRQSITSLQSTDAPEETTVTAPSDPENRTLLSKEYFSMIDDFSRYTPRDIATVENARYRALFLGIAAGSQAPEVLRAFEVLYEDMLPVRVAGRMIFRHLGGVMEKSLERRESEERSIGEKTGLSVEAIDDGRRAFLAVKDDDEREGLSIEQLVDSGIVSTAVELIGYESFDEFLEKMEMDKKGLLSFEEFMIGLQRCWEDSTVDECNIPYVLGEIAEKMVPIEEEKNMLTVDERKKKHNDRFDNMVETFNEWEKRIPGGEGRMLDVLRGCFVGARNLDVINAIRIVYLDYSALRVAGNLVFKLSRRMMGEKAK